MGKQNQQTRKTINKKTLPNVLNPQISQGGEKGEGPEGFRAKFPIPNLGIRWGGVIGGFLVALVGWRGIDRNVRRE